MHDHVSQPTVTADPRISQLPIVIAPPMPGTPLPGTPLPKAVQDPVQDLTDLAPLPNASAERSSELEDISSQVLHPRDVDFEDTQHFGQGSASSAGPRETDVAVWTNRPLPEHWSRSGTTGRGLEILQRLEDADVSRAATRKTPDDPEGEDKDNKRQNRSAFIAERVAIPLGTNKNRRKQMAGTNLVYDKCDQQTQKGLDKSRSKELQKWMDFNAGVVIEGEVLNDLINDGYPTIPMQLIETDKNAHKKRQGKEHLHVPEFKSRMVACAHLEDTTGIRADSPTCATEGFNLICSYAACKKLRVKTGDLTNAYFTADLMDRLILMSPPRGGIPGKENQGKYAVAANMPVYGTKDAGRRFYKTFRRRALAEGLTEMKLCKSLYVYHNKDNEVVILAGAHVNGILWAAVDGYEHIITDHLFKHFQLNHSHEGEFLFCGRDYVQSDDFSVYVTCKNNIEKIIPINFNRSTRGLEDKAISAEISQMRSVNGSMAWIARQVRPEYCYQSSSLQSVVSTAKVKHLIQCNKVLADLQATANIGIFFKSGAFKFVQYVFMGAFYGKDDLYFKCVLVTLKDTRRH